MKTTTTKSKELFIEYKMPEEMAKELLKSKKAKGYKGTPNEFLCDYVNEQKGLRGYCVSVITY